MPNSRPIEKPDAQFQSPSPSDSHHFRPSPNFTSPPPDTPAAMGAYRFVSELWKRKQPDLTRLVQRPATVRRLGSDAKQLHKPIEETNEGIYPSRMHSQNLPAKIRIAMKSFNNQNHNLKGLEPYTHKIGLPESRALYTVLRSPHIDKKSREQFSTHVKKLFVVKKAETHELARKFFWLKRLRVLGAQYEVNISFKTRLDKMIGCSEGGGLLRQ
ncbi:hypothetical protein CFC21_039259 [Triticum aestivum]|uniref:Small ribosomal subunit protein uS10 domain-containing protein n=3 Tax=Triticum TaxID=4564 RepID=A0A9R1FEH8_WHEAT|nr:uncharacterized protein LOC123068351 [Triticum aestivum]XP_044346862.1 uncharacterized protein LOC123068351 [Triticum aestivum]KAF7027194.1 hypothetical protein CFC21_039259 [Triticum aestivum]